MYIYKYIYLPNCSPYIMSSTAGLSLKYNNQMFRNSKPATARNEDTISTLSNLKNLFFSCINFKTSMNRLTCENTFSVIAHISS